jgi:hypothetical protein
MTPSVARRYLGGLLLLLLAGCVEQPGPTGSTDTAQRECESSGGVWRGSRCERAAGGY